MRYNKLFLASMLAVVASMFQSCLKDQEDIFDESGAVRAQEYLDNAKEVLTSSEYGWAFDYYPDKNIKYGGYVYTVKFEGSEVTAQFELKPGEVEKSLYKLCDDNGPTLTFDSYNSLLHHFATPSSSAYQAKDGDFEFMIMEVTPDLIRLRGKRTGNTMYLHRLNQTADVYMDGVSKMSDNLFLTGASGVVGTTDVRAEFDLDTRYCDLYWGDKKAGAYFVPSPTGISFADPIDMDGAMITALDFDAELLTYTGKDSKGNDVSMTGILPDTYEKFDEFSGDYTLYYQNDTRQINVTLVGDKAANTFTIKGLNANYDVIATYKKSMGCIEINSQQVTTDGDKLIWFCSWGLNPATGSGSISWSTDEGILLVKDPENPGTYVLTPKGNTTLGHYPNSFAAYYFTSTVGGNPKGQADSKWRFKSTSGITSQLTYITKIVKR